MPSFSNSNISAATGISCVSRHPQRELRGPEIDHVGALILEKKIILPNSNRLVFYYAFLYNELRTSAVGIGRRIH